MFRFYFMDYYYLVLVIPALLIAGYAQMKVSSTFNKYSKVKSSRGQTAATVARQILDYNGLQNIRIENVRGNLTDHYDPKAGVIRLSDSVYSSTSIASIGVAAHEVGHAVQHAQAYAPLTIRNAIIPITNIGSTLSIPLILFGFLMGADALVTIGIVAFSLVTVFQLITLPVEFNASKRALVTLESDNFLYEDEVQGAKKVLGAAALTYVAALIVSVAQLLRLVLLYGGRRNRD